MQIKDVMSPNAVVTTPEARCCDAAKLMREHDIGALPVHRDEKLLGMVTDRDICCEVVAREQSHETPVERAMSDRVLYCRDSDDTRDVARNMADNAVRRLPVVDDDKRLVGMISLTDIAERDDEDAAGESLAKIKAS
ncbi:MAG: CBS domain-containing protein [Oceanicaulis sp.]